MPPKSPVLPVPPKSKLGICSRILRPIQTTKPICWFLAVIVVMFYSQRSRKVIMEASKTWDRQNKVIELFRDVLYDRYLTVGSDPYKSEEYNTFNENTFVKILQELYNMDSRNFPNNPKDNEGYYMVYYLCKLHTLLGIDYKAFDYEPSSQDIYYSSINKEFDSIYKSTIPHKPDIPYLLHPNVGVYEDDGRAPSILIITRFTLLTPFANNNIVDDDIKRELSSMKQKITYNGYEYNLDSVHLLNLNTGCKHSIVGITCKNKKFIFNGHPLYNRNFPCVLIQHNWNIQKDRDFYLSSKDCELHDDPQPDSLKHRYNFSKVVLSEGDQRGFIYVRKNASRDTSNSLEKDVEKYFETRKEAAILEEEIERARLLYDEKERKEIEAEAKRKEEIERAKLRYEEKERKEIEAEAILEAKRKEAIRLFYEKIENKKQETKKKHQELQKEARMYLDKQQKERELLIKEEDNFASNLKNIEAFMAKLKLDDIKRKRKSSSNSSPKLITQTPKKQYTRASPPKKANTKGKDI